VLSCSRLGDCLTPPGQPPQNPDDPPLLRVAGLRPRSAEDDRIDYAEVGLISGLEVHQQLLTERKLFCQCPAGCYTRVHDGTVLRHMRPTLSELGVYDGTALMEFKTRKHIIYLLNRENTCTYEMDDTPPFLVNQQAVDIAIEQCLMLGCDIVDEVHIARKQYLDGSIPTGFQRTAIVGVNGRLPFRDRELTITQVSVEEDSCREVSDRGHLIIWRTDRLGMPLIETVTGPDLRTPDEVAEAILLVGRVCRSTGHVRVGIGASRQDVNVSVRGGRRVEIKGVPKAGWAPALVHGEAVRQVNLLRLRDELLARGFRDPSALAFESADVTELFASCRLPALTRAGFEHWVARESRRPDFELGAGPFRVAAVRLPGLAGTLAWPTQPARSFVHELAGRVRVIAGLDQPPILLHSEDWPGALGGDLLRTLRERLGCAEADAVVVVWGPERDTRTAVDEIRLRYADAIDGIPNETRQPFPDGSTDFERILPGPDRMYPDTDSPPTRVTRERVETLRSVLPPRPWERESRYAAAGVPASTRHYLIRRGGAAFVDRVVDACGGELRFACFLFGERLVGLRRSGVQVERISAERWCELFRTLSGRPVLKQASLRLVREMAAAPDASVEAILARLGLNTAPADWRDRLRPALAAAVDAAYDGAPGRIYRLALARLMPGLRGLVPADEAVASIRESLGMRD
jgi:glutamyl-tRNA(Gln) amidotransferase subunit E